jgi:hypothetical protein
VRLYQEPTQGAFCLPRFINRPSDVKIAQVQDDFYGNVGTYNSIDNTTKHLSEGRDSVTYTLLITKIESCRYEYKR